MAGAAAADSKFPTDGRERNSIPPILVVGDENMTLHFLLLLSGVVGVACHACMRVVVMYFSLDLADSPSFKRTFCTA